MKGLLASPVLPIHWLDLPPRMQAALAQLLEAATYARATDRDRWQFAVEMERLLAGGLTVSDLRWLAVEGYIEHAWEITRPEDSVRRFDQSRSLAFGPKTCFVLTQIGAAALGAISAVSARKPRLRFAA